MLTLLAGCGSVWTQYGYGPENQRFNPNERTLTRANVATLTQSWSVPTNEVTSAPIVSNGRVYVRSFESGTAPERRDLLAFNSSTGATIWQTTLPPGSAIPGVFTPPAALSGNELHLGTGHSFTRFDPASGATLGQVGTGDFVESAIVTGDGVHALVTLEPTSSSLTLQVRDAQTLTERWRAQLPPPIHQVPDTTGVSVGNGRIFTASEGWLLSFPAAGCGASTCAPTWSRGTRTTFNPPVVVGDIVFVSTYREVIAYAADTGAELWRDEITADIPSFMAAANGVVYVTSGSWLMAYDADGCGASVCEPIWSALLDAGIALTPSVAGGVVYVAIPGAIKAFDASGCGAARCAELASVPIAAHPTSISIAEGKLFATTTQPSTVTALAPA